MALQSLLTILGENKSGWSDGEEAVAELNGVKETLLARACKCALWLFCFLLGLPKDVHFALGNE